MRDKVYKIRLSEEEYKELCGHKPIAKYIRSRLFGDFVPTKPPFVPTKFEEVKEIVPTFIPSSSRFVPTNNPPVEDWDEDDIRVDHKTFKYYYKDRELSEKEVQAWKKVVSQRNQ